MVSPWDARHKPLNIDVVATGDHDFNLSFQRSEIYKSSLADTVNPPYDRYVFLCFKSPNFWPSCVKEFDSDSDYDLLPKLFSSTIMSRKNNINVKILSQPRLSTLDSRGLSATSRFPTTSPSLMSLFLFRLHGNITAVWLARLVDGLDRDGIVRIHTYRDLKFVQYGFVSKDLPACAPSVRKNDTKELVIHITTAYKIRFDRTGRMLFVRLFASS
ncbi:uncharacterized protein LOC131148456 [Malania oleifera]|uniref:uncharacterized protein LOC131148456 n=1 Tax=Malania oleifera TaxID=397392 RepID=UPI0025AE6AAC|nr:uncharacterized protein LOC131148456 [Malania oleifera]